MEEKIRGVLSLSIKAVAGSTPVLGAIKLPRPTQATQPSTPQGKVNRVPVLLAGVKAWCVRLCQVASNIV